MKKNILVTGGAGYIGSFISRELEKQNFRPFIVDDFSSGHLEAIKGYPHKRLNLVDGSTELDQLFKKEKFEGVIHMASFIQMGESFVNPGKYFDNNLRSAITLFDVMAANNVKRLIFSSSAGVYGNPKKLPIKENDSKLPENPYGETKLMIERMLHWYDKAHGIKSVSIRYFNAAGASLDGSIGENHPNESHLIPLIIKAALGGKTFTLYGDDYNTPDGTCVRDYVHVLDLARAHTLSLESLINGAETTAYNAGAGKGHSNLEIVEEVKKATGKFDWKIGPRRKGDADTLYASISKIKKELGWKPKYGMKDIIGSSYLWHKSHPDGY